MANFLRDEQIFNLTADEEALSQLIEVFAQRGLLMPEYRQTQPEEPLTVFLFYTIRFDQKGYRVFNGNEFLNYFKRANDVERILFDLRSASNVSSNGNIGSYANLKLDTSEAAACFLTVSSDSEEWVNGTFGAIKEILQKCKNRHALFRNPIVDFLIQLLGLATGFAMSLWGASIIAPNLKIENSFLISFLVVLIIFSNLWGQIKSYLQAFIYRTFPNIEFLRPKKNKLHWLLQRIIGSIVIAFALYTFNQVFNVIGLFLGAFVQ